MEGLFRYKLYDSYSGEFSVWISNSVLLCSVSHGNVLYIMEGLFYLLFKRESKPRNEKKHPEVLCQSRETIPSNIWPCRGTHCTYTNKHSVCWNSRWTEQAFRQLSNWSKYLRFNKIEIKITVAFRNEQSNIYKTILTQHNTK